MNYKTFVFLKAKDALTSDWKYQKKNGTPMLCSNINIKGAL